MHWIAWSLVANASIMWIEYANHHFPQPAYWRQLLFFTGAPILLAQYGLFRAYAGADHLLLAWLVFNLGNAFMRLSMVAVLSHESFAWWTPAGVALMTLGAYVVKQGLRYGEG